MDSAKNVRWIIPFKKFWHVKGSSLLSFAKSDVRGWRFIDIWQVEEFTDFVFQDKIRLVALNSNV